MTINEKIKLLEETLDVEEGTLKEDAMLKDVEKYDSIAKLSLIVMFEDEFGKVINGETVKQFQTVSDILDLMD